MEVLLSYNWNVYKLFTNSNRAKAPFAVIESEDCESEGFRNMVRKNLEGLLSRNVYYSLIENSTLKEGEYGIYSSGSFYELS